MNVKPVGTIRDGRNDLASLSEKIKFTKGDRGLFEYASNDKVCLMRWSDNNLVT
jgi:hypothetical protein